MVEAGKRFRRHGAVAFRQGGKRSVQLRPRSSAAEITGVMISSPTESAARSCARCKGSAWSGKASRRP